VAPWEEGHCWEREGAPLDVGAMRAAAAHLVGIHHFGAFRANTDSDKSCADPRGLVRRLWRLEVLDHAVNMQAGITCPAHSDMTLDAPVASASGSRRSATNGEKGRQLVSVILEADRFLMRMARLIVGTLVEVRPRRTALARSRWGDGRAMPPAFEL
jgi:tRNA U38,U39,U40 pseudouridine synthase TruA